MNDQFISREDDSGGGHYHYTPGFLNPMSRRVVEQGGRRWIFCGVEGLPVPVVNPTGGAD
jgi:hypothetical protein